MNDKKTTNPLLNVPLNTKRIYVMGKTPKGCEVYMPVDFDDDTIIAEKKEALQIQLNSVFTEPDEPEVA